MTINYSGGTVTDRLRRAFRTVGRATVPLEESLLPVVNIEDVSKAPFSKVERGVFGDAQSGVAGFFASVAIGMVDVGQDDLLVVHDCAVILGTAGNVDIMRNNGQIDAGFGTKSKARTDWRFEGTTAQVADGNRSTGVPLAGNPLIIRIQIPTANVWEPVPGLYILTPVTTLIAQVVTANTLLRFRGVWEIYRQVL